MLVHLCITDCLKVGVSPLPFQPLAGQPPHRRPGTSSAVRLGVVKLTVWDGNSIWSSTEGFANERAFVAQVRPFHPHIVQYFAVTDDFLFMEYHPLGSLEAYLKPDAQPPVLRWTIQLCSALVYLHDLGYAHNQVYPCNILVASGGNALKLCDFETVTLGQDFVGGTYPNDPEVERAFHSDDPELYTIRGDLSDVYSLGLIMWFLQNGGAEPPDNRLLTYDDGCPYPRFVGAFSHHDILDISGLFLGDLMRLCWVPQNNRLTSREVMAHLLKTRERLVSFRPSRI
jgi:serine/threonine protein kinase